MHQNNRNLFPITAVLATAGIIFGVCGAILMASDQVGGGPSVVPNSASPDLAIDGRVAIASESATTSDAQVVADVGSLAASATLGIHKSTVLSVAVPSESPDRSLVASGSYDNTVKVWGLSTDSSRPGIRSEMRSLLHNGRVNDLAFVTSGEQQQLVTGSGSGEITLWNPNSGEAITTIADKSGRIVSIAASLDGTRFASGSSNGTLKVWPVAEIGKQKSQTNLRGQVLAPSGPQISALAFHPTDKDRLVSGDHDGVIQVWDLQRNQPTLTLTSNADRIDTLSISPDGQYVASGSYDNIIRIWNLTTGKPVQTLSGHDFVVSDVAFSPDGKTLASSSFDESIKLWNWADGTELCTLNGHAGFVYSVAFVDGSSTLVSGGYDGTVRSWNLAETLTTNGSKRCMGTSTASQ